MGGSSRFTAPTLAAYPAQVLSAAARLLAHMDAVRCAPAEYGWREPKSATGHHLLVARLAYESGRLVVILWAKILAVTQCEFGPVNHGYGPAVYFGESSSTRTPSRSSATSAVPWTWAPW